LIFLHAIVGIFQSAPKPLRMDTDLAALGAVTQDMVDEVLAICPHVPLRLVRRDLAGTLSVETTVNRILDGSLRLEVALTPCDQQ
jgi:hypothetical protein